MAAMAATGIPPGNTNPHLQRVHQRRIQRVSPWQMKTWLNQGRRELGSTASATAVGTGMATVRRTVTEPGGFVRISITPESGISPVEDARRRKAHRLLTIGLDKGVLTTRMVSQLLRGPHNMQERRSLLGFSQRPGGPLFFPAFQFDLQTGIPLPVVGEVVRIAGPEWKKSSLIQWFYAPNGYLDGLRPVDVIDDRPVLLAAARKSLSAPW